MPIAAAAMPAAILICALLTVFSGRASFDDFLEGTKDGVNICVKLLPTLIVLVSAVTMLSASGATEWLSGKLAPFCEKIGVPPEILPLVLMRPFSGSASSAMIADIFEKYGADSFAGRTASVLLGSSETIIYVAAVYFAAAGVKRTRHALPAAFLTMLFCVFLSSLLCRLMF